MKCHQVLTGSANPGSHCYSVGQINNFTFWVYGSGCDLVISSSADQPIQIISSEGNGQITAVDCTETSGIIAVAYGKSIVTFAPQVVDSSVSAVKYNWIESSSFQLGQNDGNAEILSWNHNEDLLLVGCSRISLWAYTSSQRRQSTDCQWKHSWSSGLDETPVQLAFSPNASHGHLFASVAQGECMIKVWYARHHASSLQLLQKMHTNSVVSDETELQSDYIQDYTFTYLLHPQPVIGFEWRKNAFCGEADRFSNVLISSCLDQICRIWSETKQPVSRLLRFQTTLSHASKSGQRKQSDATVDLSSIADHADHEMTFWNPLHDSSRGQDIRHFHIAASINPVSDIPLLPSFASPNQGSCGVSAFTVHWLNNKYHQSQLLTNKYIAEHRSQTDIDTPGDSVSKLMFASKVAEDIGISDSSSSSIMKRKCATHGLAERLLCAWRDSRDALFSIHPSDGSLLVWHVDWLDEDRAGRISQPQVCFSSRIPMAFSSADAATLCPRVILFVNHSTKPNLLHSASYVSFQSKSDSEETDNKNEIYSSVQLLSKHRDGSLNVWQISFSDNMDFSSITSVSHSARFCGHCFHLSGILSHPLLPLMVTTAGHQSNRRCNFPASDESELILWRVDPIGPLSYSGGLSELARVSCMKDHQFANVAWFPVLFPSWCLGLNNNSPSTSLISLSQNNLQIYQAVVDAGKILADVFSPVAMSQSVNKVQQTLVSQQSSAHPGCMLHLLSVKDEGKPWGEILFIETFPAMIMSSSSGESAKLNSAKFNKEYFVVMLEQSCGVATLHTWTVMFSANMAALKGARNRRPTILMSDSSDDSSEEIVEDFPQVLSHVGVHVTKLSAQKLCFPTDCAVVSACSWAGRFTLLFASELQDHLYPAPYHLCTACSDNCIYFWSCAISHGENTSYGSCQWKLWNSNPTNMPGGKSIPVRGFPVMVKAASPALIACLYVVDKGDKHKDLGVSVYECASSGGSTWKEQELIEYHAPDVSQSQFGSNFHLDWLSQEEGSFFLAVGYSTNIQIFSLAPSDMKKCTKIHHHNTSTDSSVSPAVPHFMRQSSLDVHTRQRLLSTKMVKDLEASSDWFNQSRDDAAEEFVQWKLLQWTKLTEQNIQSSANSLHDTNQPDNPITVSWARDGMLVAASATEMHVFSQWIPDRNLGLDNSEITKPVEGELMIGLSEVVDKMCPSLQQYHPHVLSELLNSGHLDVVRSILIHLAVCLNGDYHDNTCYSEAVQVEKFQFCEPFASSIQLCFTGSHVTPLFLHELLGHDGSIQIASILKSKDDADKTPTQGKRSNSHNDLDDIFKKEIDTEETDNMDDELDEILGLKQVKQKAKPSEKFDLSKLDSTYFGKEHCKVIHDFLIHNQLPGLNSHDQMELMALADTLEMTSASGLKDNDSDDLKYSENRGVMGLTAGERGYAVSGGGAGALDNCGLRYVMALHNHLCLLNSLPASNRVILQKQGLNTCQYAWAFHSEAEEEILSLLPSVQRGAPLWSELQSLGAGWWIRSTVLLKKLVEQTARAAFLVKNDPLDAAIFYLALNKKSVLCGLFRSVKNLRMLTFFQNNFSEERWRRAALKNAFALMGKQRFHEAAAFFLLSGSVKDAVEVCIDKLKDVQLALVICRLREKSDLTFHHMLKVHVLGQSEEQNIKEGKLHSDAFIRSMAHWTLGNYGQAVETLLQNIHYEDITDIFNFYMYLRSHPIVLRNKAQNVEKDFPNISVEQRHKMSSFCINDQERQLVFQTAVAHLEAGCPVLALDSLTKLGNLFDAQQSLPVQFEASPTAEKLSKPSATDDVSSSVDWSAPVFDNCEDELQLDWSEDEEVQNNSGEEVPVVKEIPKILTQTDSEVVSTEMKKMKHDVFAHHLRMTACFKIFVQELKAIASAYSSDGGQLRSKLYIWLENASDVFHRVFGLSEFTIDDNMKPISHTLKVPESSSDNEATTSEAGSMPTTLRAPSLHELILADNQDWKTRRIALARRRKWLQRHHNFLRTLLSYCNLHESTFGLLATMRMELLLLLQESIQNRSLIHLSSPLPPPSENIPLITSVVAMCKTVVADPFTHLSHMTKDILRSVLEFSNPPHPDGKLCLQDSAVLCSQAATLSSCIYQSLCDTSTPSFRSQLLKADGSGASDGLHEGIEYSSSPTQISSAPSFLQQSATPIHTSNYVAPTTTPAQWPGVAVLQALLNSEMSSGESRMKIIVLLCEATAGVFMSLLIHSLQSCSASLMYRLSNHKLGSKMWSAVFGGGVKLHVKYAKSRLNVEHGSSTDLHKLRERLNLKLLYHQDRRSSISSSGGQEQSAYREKFVPPEISLWDWFLTKPFVTPSKDEGLDFDSDLENDETNSVSSLDHESVEEDNDIDDAEKCKRESYSWKLMRLGLVQIVASNLQSFLPLAGLDLSELNANSPLLGATLQLLQEWQAELIKEIEECGGPPPDFLPSLGSSGYVASPRGFSTQRPAMLKYQVMLEPNNTPFQGCTKESMGYRRLWHSLVKKESLQEMFIKYIFHRSACENKITFETDNESSLGVSHDGTDSEVSRLKQDFGGKVTILHKEADLLAAFCVNNVNSNCIALASSKDVQELDLSVLLTADNWAWIDEPLCVSNMPTSGDDDFLIVSTPSKSSKVPQIMLPGSHSSVPWTSTSQTGQGANVLMKRPVTGIRRMESHPTLPYYLTGSRDGSIYMWEWGHQQQISQYQSAGHFSKISNLHFSALGNKISAVDADGYLTMWQVSSSTKPFLKHMCHDRGAHDCCFISSASVLATAGISTSNKNVAVWDTLMPKKSCLVKDFTVHEQAGAYCVQYMPRYRTLLAAGKNGHVTAFDDRCLAGPVHQFLAHESPIKCLAIDPLERFYITGSAGGDIKVWDSVSHKLYYESSNEHARTSLFKNFGSGTVQVLATTDHILTCGADGSLKMKTLPDLDFWA